MGRGKRRVAGQRVIYWAPGPRTVVCPARKMARTRGGSRIKWRQAEGKEGGRTGAGKGKGKGKGKQESRNEKLSDDQVWKGRRAA